MLSEAAKATGDKATDYEAMDNYISISRVIDSLRKVSIDREIMIRESFANSPLLSQANAKDTNKEATTVSARAMTIIASILGVLLIIYMVLYFKLRMKK